MAVRIAAALLAIPAILLVVGAVASLPWTPDRTASPPRVVASARGAGPLRAGVGEARFALPAGVPIGGFTRLGYSSEGTPGPVGARALVVEEPGCRVALVSAEILLVPEDLDAEVAARVADDCIGYLEAPIKRVTTPDVPAPAAPALENAILPQAASIVAAVNEILG